MHAPRPLQYHSYVMCNILDQLIRRTKRLQSAYATSALWGVIGAYATPTLWGVIGAYATPTVQYIIPDILMLLLPN